MKITENWLKEKDACSDIIKWFNSQKETDSVKIIQKLIKEGNLDWANWFISRLLNPKNNIKYSVFAAKLAQPNFEKVYPEDSRLQIAIDATVLCIENPTEKNMNAAKSAADSVYDAANTAKSDYCAASYTADSEAFSEAFSAAFYAAFSAYYAYYVAKYANSVAYYVVRSVYNAAKSAYYAAKSAKMRTYKKILEYGIKIYKEQVEVQK